MSDEVPDLSNRYYAAEAAVWLLGTILLVTRFLGVSSDQNVPYLDLDLANKAHFPRVLAALLAGAALYLLFEWKQAPLTTRQGHLRGARARSTMAWAAVCLSLSAPLLLEGTRFRAVSAAWFLFYTSIGLLIGTCVTFLADAALMIRSPTEAQRLGLPRVPVASRAQFVVFVPALLLLNSTLVATQRLWPTALGGVALILAGIGFFAAIGSWAVGLLYGRDAHGKRISYQRRLAALRDIHDAHDYAYVVAAVSSSLPSKVRKAFHRPPRRTQEFMKKRFGPTEPNEPVRFRVEVQEEIGMSVRGGENEWSVTVTKAAGKPNVVSVRALAEDPALPPKEMEVPVDVIERAAEEYLANHPDASRITTRELFSNAINGAVSTLLVRDAKDALHEVAMQGLDGDAKLLLDHGTDANARGAGGWTPLLRACAQGHPQVAGTLLERGANPDVGNVHRITPLMYAARYDHGQICSLLIEYGAQLNLQDIYGETALMVAARWGHVDVAKLLVDAGADVSLRTSAGKSARDLAHEHGHGAVAKLLRTLPSIEGSPGPS